MGDVADDILATFNVDELTITYQTFSSLLLPNLLLAITLFSLE